MNPLRRTRREFLGYLGMSAVAASVAQSTAGSELPPVTNPRATDGDKRFEPNWAERLTVTVGQKDADLIGRDDRVLQAAVDYVARFGGGTVHVLPGTYTLRSSVVLPSKIRLLGSGAESIITKIPSETVDLAADSDWYDQEVTLQDAKVSASATASCCDRRIRTPAARRSSSERSSPARAIGSSWTTVCGKTCG